MFKYANEAISNQTHADRQENKVLTHAQSAKTPVRWFNNDECLS